jgi:hypothetical protein
MKNRQIFYASGEPAELGDIVEFPKPGSGEYRLVIDYITQEHDDSALGLQFGDAGLLCIPCTETGESIGEPAQRIFIAASSRYFFFDKIDAWARVRLIAENSRRHLMVIVNADGWVVWPQSMIGLPANKCLLAADFVLTESGEILKDRSGKLQVKH